MIQKSINKLDEAIPDMWVRQRAKDLDIEVYENYNFWGLLNQIEKKESESSIFRNLVGKESQGRIIRIK